VRGQKHVRKEDSNMKDNNRRFLEEIMKDEGFDLGLRLGMLSVGNV
jgi:hypothetical protein